MIVREAVAADLDAIVALQREDVIREVHEDDVPPAECRAAFDEITADAHQQLLVGELDGDLVATAQVTWIRRLTYVGGEMGVVESVRVRSDLRGRGLGERLMRYVVDLARDRGTSSRPGPRAPRASGPRGGRAPRRRTAARRPRRRAGRTPARGGSSCLSFRS